MELIKSDVSICGRELHNLILLPQ